MLRDCRLIDSLGMLGRHRHGRFVFALRGADAPYRAVFSTVTWVARVDDRWVISGIIFVIKNRLRWRDAPPGYGPHKTIYNRFIRWSRLGVFNKIFSELARKAGKSSRLMIDATHLKAHRTAASLLKKGLYPDVSGARRAA